MKNFKVIDKNTNKEFWISRSIAVTAIVYFVSDNKPYILIEKRGKGCPDFVGKYCLPCGYLDWGETIEEAAKREIYEEVGLRLNEHYCKFIGIQDDPKDNVKQNVTIRVEINVSPNEIIKESIQGYINTNTLERGGEANEVDEILFISPDDINHIEFAWNHNEVIKNWINEQWYEIINTK